MVGPTSGDVAVTLAGTVTAVEPLGPETLVHFEAGGEELVATAPGRMVPLVDSAITAHAAPGTLHLFDATTERTVARL
jgi:multiple sugar transport system ATP-binding protein